jgi:hypothetical protein
MTSLIVFSCQKTYTFSYAIEKTIEWGLTKYIEKSNKKIIPTALISLGYCAWHIGQIIYPQIIPDSSRIKLGVATFDEYLENLDSADVLFEQKTDRIQQISMIIDKVETETQIKVSKRYINNKPNCDLRAFRFFSDNSIMINAFWLETAIAKDHQILSHLKTMLFHEFGHFKHYHLEIKTVLSCTLSLLRCLYAASNKNSVESINTTINVENAKKLCAFYTADDHSWRAKSLLNRMLAHQADQFALHFIEPKDQIKTLEFAATADFLRKNKSKNHTTIQLIQKYGVEWIGQVFKIYGYSDYPSIRQRILRAKKETSKTDLIWSDINCWIWW